MSDFQRIETPQDDPQQTGGPPPPGGQAHDAASREKRGAGRGCFWGCGLSAIVVCIIAAAAVLVLSSSIGIKAGPAIWSGLAAEPDNIVESVIVAGDPDRKIAVIRVSGIIYSGTRYSSDNSASEMLIKQLEKARRDADVVGVMLDMNTPGGEVTATDEIHHAIQKLRADGILVLTCMRSVAASGGYYLAAGTDYIVANRLTLTGSIGVIIGGYNYAELFDMVGLESELYQSGEMKDMLNMARQRTAEEKKLIQELVDEIHHEFATVVAAGRPDLEIDDVKSGPIGEAQIFSGKKAKELGLVDELGYFEDAVVKARELAKAANATIVRYTYRPTLGNLLFSLKGPGTGLLGRLLPEEQQIVKKGRLYFLLPRAY